MVLAISVTVGSEDDGLSDRADIIDAVCFRVTMFEIGVVKALEHAPAIIPTANSSSAGSVVVLVPCF
jgi:hypothetical protein